MRSQATRMLLALVASRKVAVTVAEGAVPVVGESEPERGNGGVVSGTATIPWGCQPELSSATVRPAMYMMRLPEKPEEKATLRVSVSSVAVVETEDPAEKMVHWPLLTEPVAPSVRGLERMVGPASLTR